MNAQLIVLPPPELLSVHFYHSATIPVMEYNQYGHQIPSNSFVSLGPQTGGGNSGENHLLNLFDFYNIGYDARNQHAFSDCLHTIQDNDFGTAFASMGTVRKWIEDHCTLDVFAQKSGYSYKFLFLDGPTKKFNFQQWYLSERQSRCLTLNQISNERWSNIMSWIADNFGEDYHCTAVHSGGNASFWCPDPDTIIAIKMRWDGPDEVAI